MPVEVTVDQTPRPQLPYDPNDIPEAVRNRAAAVDALYAQNGQAPPEPLPVPEQLRLPIEAPEVRAPVQEAPNNVPAPAIPPSVLSAEDDNSQSWHHRYLAMQGRYNASQKTIGEMQEQMTQLGNELLHTQRSVAQQSKPAPRPASYLTEKDVEDYGTDLVDFAQRAAAQAVAPQLQEIERQNQELQRRLAQEARARLDLRVESAVPNYREIDSDPRWHQWLLGIDVLSGRVRQTLLNEAVAAADAPRAISFFRGFLQEEQATGHIEPAQTSQQAAPPREAAIPLASLAAPGRARPAGGGDSSSLPPDRPIYTRAQISQLYSQHRRGAYVGREAEWSRQEADFFAAQREGRVR